MTSLIFSSGQGESAANNEKLQQFIDYEKREVKSQVYSDPVLYQLELEKIWAKQWVVVGHESEIPKPGDYVTRKVGDDPVIVSRDRDGQIQCMLNMCPHRGAEVARAESGNTSVFRCIYHGWVFNLDGSFRGAPFVDELYSKEEKKVEHMCLPRARVSVFAGIIFVNWDSNAPSLEESLGDFTYYLNMVYNRPKNGMEVLGAPQRFVVDGNWKIAAEQFACDALHAGQLHRSLSTLSGGDRNNAEDWQLYAPSVSTKEAHSIICFDQTLIFRKHDPDHAKVPAIEKLRMVPPPGMTSEMVDELLDRFSPEDLQFLADTPPSNGSLFPNIGIWNMNQLFSDGTTAPYISLRTYSPVGVNQFEFTNWSLVAKDAPEEYRDRLRKTLSFSQGAGGFVEQDDAETWPGITAAAKGFIGRQQTLKYWALAGHNPPAYWPSGGTGEVHTGFSKDDAQWKWWQRYFSEMTSKA
jgi:nitrite reductase/ring-hydroxylating ferredoxin subunit